MIKAYIILHHNLAFSSIPSEHYKYIIKDIYSQFLHISKDFPLGLEFNGQTLDIINNQAPEYIDQLKKLIHQKNIELIGSSYSQAIFPLIPAKVNLWNLELGLNSYQTRLNIVPQIALLNEQVYSETILPLYKKVGYKAIIFDWMNAIKDNNWPYSYRFRPVYHSNSKLYILWSDCIIFQKFQRVIWAELDFCEWLEFLSILIEDALRSGLNENNINICLYASDAEIFDYRPSSIGSYSYKNGEIDRIFELLEYTSNKLGIQLYLPSSILEYNNNNKINVNNITTTSYPIRTKKQDKYNITRWAVTGREATKMNTQCYQLLDLINKIENNKQTDQQIINNLKRDLVILWGSDFRTHTIDEKFEFFRHKMGSALYKAKRILGEKSYGNNLYNYNGKNNWHSIKTNFLPSIKIKGRKITINNKGKQLTLLLNKGLAIESFIDTKISNTPIIGTIAHGFFNDISFGSDFFSGHFILLTHEGRQISDLSLTMDDLEVQQNDKEVSIRNKLPKILPNLELIKTISLTEDTLKISYNFYAKDLRPASLRLGIITILPHAFDINSLFFKTHQGGFEQETFYLKNNKILQDQPVNHVVTSRHCLGFSEARLTIGDKDKEIEIETDPKKLYCVPLFHFEEIDKDIEGIKMPRYFCRVYFTICERDDVAQVFWKGPISIDFSIKIKSNN